MILLEMQFCYLVINFYSFYYYSYFLGSTVRYTGCFKNGKREGFGKLEEKIDPSLESYRLIYKGSWKDDKIDEGKYFMTEDNNEVIVKNGKMSKINSPELQPLKNTNQQTLSTKNENFPFASNNDVEIKPPANNQGIKTDILKPNKVVPFVDDDIVILKEENKKSSKDNDDFNSSKLFNIISYLKI